MRRMFFYFLFFILLALNVILSWFPLLFWWMLLPEGKIVSGTNSIFDKNVDMGKFPQDIFNVSGKNEGHSRIKKMDLNCGTIYTDNIELFICRRNCNQKPSTQRFRTLTQLNLDPQYLLIFTKPFLLHTMQLWKYFSFL